MRVRTSIYRITAFFATGLMLSLTACVRAKMINNDDDPVERAPAADNTPLAAAAPGFAIVNGGGIVSSAQVSAITTIGETVSPVIQTSATMTNFSGIQGMFYTP